MTSPESLVGAPDTRTREVIILDALTNRVMHLESQVVQLQQSMLTLMNRELNRPQFSPSVYPATSPLAERSAPSYPSPPPPEEPDPTWAPVYHRPFPIGCGKIAQYLQHKMPANAIAQRSLLRVNTHDGRGWRVPDEYEHAACATCTDVIDPHSARDLDWSQAIQRTPTERLPREVSEEDEPSMPKAISELLTEHAAAEQRASLETAMRAAQALRWGSDDAEKTP